MSKSPVIHRHANVHAFRLETRRALLRGLVTATLLASSATLVASPARAGVVVTSIGGLAAPATVAVAPSGTYAYVANYVSGGIGSLSKVDLVNNVVTDTITAPGFDPYFVAISPDGTYGYATNYLTGTLSRIDTSNDAIVGSVSGLTGAYELAIAPDSSFAYVTADAAGTVTRIDAATDKASGTVTGLANPQGVAIAPDGMHAYVANYGTGTVTVIDTATNQVSATIAGMPQARRIALSPDGTFAYVSAGTSIYRIDTATNEITTTITGLNAPFDIAFTKNGSAAFFTDLNSGTLGQINPTTNGIVQTLGALGSPTSVAVSDDGGRVYVANSSGGAVWVIDPLHSAPSAPKSVQVEPGRSSLVVSWATPDTDGGSPIIGYTASDDAGHTCHVATTDPTPLTCTLTGLVNGTRYSVTVVAQNVYGTGPVSAAVFGTPGVVPTVPLDVVALAYDQEVALTWNPPADDGGQAVTYAAQADPPDGTCAVTATQALCTGLQNGRSYTFRVVATNRFGTSPPSAPSAAVVPGPPDRYVISALHLSTTKALVGQQIALSAACTAHFANGHSLPVPTAAPFTVQFRLAGQTAWTSQSSHAVKTAGTCSTRLSVRRTGSYRISMRGAASAPASLSVAFPTSVIQFRSVTSDARLIIKTQELNLDSTVLIKWTDGKFRPAPVGKSCIVQWSANGRTWKKLATGRVGYDGDLFVSVYPTQSGYVRFFAGTPSAAKYIKVVPDSPGRMIVSWPSYIYPNLHNFSVNVVVYGKTGNPWRGKVKVVLQFKSTNYAKWANVNYGYASGSSGVDIVSNTSSSGYYRIVAPAYGWINAITYTT